MNEIKVTYRISSRDFHMASYFGLVSRHQTAVKLFIASGIAALGCWAGSAMGVIPYFPFIGYIFLGYLIWALFTCAVTEHGILKYIKSPDCALFKEMTVTFAKGNMTVETPYNGKSFSLPLTKLVCAFELSDIFMIYVNAADLILLPVRALTAQQRADLRSLLLEALKDRFSTRFGYSSMLPRRSPLRRR